MPADEGGPIKRAGSRRCAAQTGQARMKAQITALASESESETTIIDTPGFQVKGPKGRRARQRTAAQMELPSTGQSEAGVEAEIPPAAARRGRAAGGRSRAATKAAKAAETRAGEPAPSESGEVAEPLERSLAKQEKSPPLSREAASLMPPPAQPGPRKRAGKAPAGKPVDGQMDLEATQLPSDSQPQRPMLPPLRSAAFTLHDGCSITGAHFGSQPSGSQQGLPTASQASVFSQSLMQTRATHPLATMNPRYRHTVAVLSEKAGVLFHAPTHTSMHPHGDVLGTQVTSSVLYFAPQDDGACQENAAPCSFHRRPAVEDHGTQVRGSCLFRETDNGFFLVRCGFSHHIPGAHHEHHELRRFGAESLV